MRSLLALPVLGALLVPAPAEASGCFVGPYAITIDPALGCEVVIVSHAQSGPTDFTVVAKRTGGDVDLTGAITSSTADVDVQYTNYDCDGGIIVDYKTPEPYNVYRIALTGAQVGDALAVTAIGDIGTVTASGACTEDMTKAAPACTGLNSGYPCEDGGGGGGGGGSGSGSGDGDGDGDSDGDSDSDSVGCSAGGGASLGGLLLLALVGGGRRRAG